MKKKPLSIIITNHMLATILGSFLALMIVTTVFVYFYAMSKAESLVGFYLNDLKDYTTYAMDRHMKEDTERFASDFESFLLAGGDELFIDEKTDKKVKEYFLMCLENNDNMDEVNVVDGNGIIRISTEDKYEGYDMHADRQSAEFLCLLEGEKVYAQEIQEISYDNKTVMSYAGAALKNTKGFLEIGTNIDTYYHVRESFLISRIRDERVGREGYYLLLDGNRKINGNRKIISSPRDIYNEDILDLSVDPEELAKSGEIIKQDIYGAESYVGAMMYDNNTMVLVYPVAEAWENWNISMSALIMIDAIVFAIIFILIRKQLSKRVVSGVESLNASLSRITEGDLDEKADFRTSLEFDGLSDGINSTVDRLKQLIKEAEERIDEELALAAKIQLSFIPHEFPPFPDRDEFELYASMIPAKEVGGDFYDYFFVDEDHLALVMADVSGKGIPAAMFMVMSKDMLRHSVMKYGTDVAEAAREVNLELIKENDAGLFVTVWLGVLTVSTGHVDYVNAGHEYPAISHAGGEFVADEDEHSIPLAARKKAKFEAGSFELAPGDILYLYTDGVNEANNADGEMFRRSRMLDALNLSREASVQEIDDNVRKAVADFVQDAPQFDDTTMLCLRYRGK